MVGPCFPLWGEVPRRGDRGAFRFASPFRSCRRGALRFASPLRSPARYDLRFLIPPANAGEGRNFFLFACPKRKNQRETTLGRGRLRFLPLPRPTLMETPKRGDPLLDLPRAVRIRPMALYPFDSPAGRPQGSPLQDVCSHGPTGYAPGSGHKISIRPPKGGHHNYSLFTIHSSLFTLHYSLFTNCSYPTLPSAPPSASRACFSSRWVRISTWAFSSIQRRQLAESV